MRIMAGWLKMLPMAGMVFLGGCGGVTTLQLTDFASSTAVQVVSQAVTSVVQAVILNMSGN